MSHKLSGTVWIAFLRAVNLGARNKVPMAALRSRLTAAGLQDVRTYLQSGNVIARSDAEIGPIIRAVVRDRFHGNSLNAAMVARRLGLHGTERNWATITKLLSLAGQVP